MFNISDDILFDKNKIKVLDGIAGSAKSSFVDSKFKGNYKRFTSTVKLMKDAKARFDCECDTIAGGLFTSEKGKFYLEERKVDYETVVIDEILQTHPRVLEWCNNNCGNYNIIICTDSRQMLPPEVGSCFIRKFKEFCQQDCVEYISLTKSYRPRNKETEELFNKLYDNVENDKRNMFEELRNTFDTIEYKDMPFNMNSVYLTHTNDIEEFLYRDKDIIHNTNLEFIAKGCIAKRDESKLNYNSYPILCQNQAVKRNVSSYLQASNIGTVTRYQGSEVHDNQKCYFLIEENSHIGNREFYTALTRCWDMKSFTIVICNNIKKEKLTFFRGFPIKRPGYIHISKDEVPANSINEKDKTIATEAFNEILNSKISTEYSYSEETIYIDGEAYSKGTPSEKPQKTKYSALGLLKKSPEFDYSFMEEVYKILDDNDIDYLKAPHYCGENHDKSQFNRQLDLFSAYPHIVKNDYLPINGKVYYEETPGKVCFYYYEGPWFNKSIITTSLYNTLKRILSEECYKVKFLFATDAQKGSKMGDILVEGCTKSVEEKSKTKEVHWGYFEKQYLQRNELNGNVWYVRNEFFNHQLLMVGILSNLYSLILTVAVYLNGIDLGRICVDAVYYNEENDNTNALIEQMKKAYEKFPYRIKDEDNNIVYQSYETLKTEKQIRAEKMRTYRKNKKENKN